MIARSDPAEGTIIITDNQTAGRGQRGNHWEAQPNQNLTCSLILKPTILQATDQFWLNMAVSVGLTDALLPLVGDTIRIKWPNDIYAGDRKLGGILIENTLHSYTLAWSVVGMGLNVNQTEFAYLTATSLQHLTPLPNGYDLPGLLRQICERIEQRYLQLRSGHREGLRTDYLNLLYRYQQEHTFQCDGDRIFRGTIVGIDASGRLAINEAGQVRYFGFKEVVFK
jgi:BirA family biotin operon repressor/biotin-[acetyl-CoA-carboxylase] ligase